MAWGQSPRSETIILAQKGHSAPCDLRHPLVGLVWTRVGVTPWRRQGWTKRIRDQALESDAAREILRMEAVLYNDV
jgi:hypothetical protein